MEPTWGSLGVSFPTNDSMSLLFNLNASAQGLGSSENIYPGPKWTSALGHKPRQDTRSQLSGAVLTRQTQAKGELEGTGRSAMF